MKKAMNSTLSPRKPLLRSAAHTITSHLKSILWILWPVYKEEQAQIIPMTAVFFFVSFIYNILNALKKTLLLSNPYLKAQAVSYLKIFGIMPAAIIFTWMTTKVITKYGQKKALQMMIAFFALSFGFLTLFIFPNREYLTFNFQPTFELVSLLNNWDITLFYIFSEMWSSIILNVLCWGIVIETTHLSQSKRIYALFTGSANIATLVAGWWAATALDHQLVWFYQAPLESLTWVNRLMFQMSVMWILQVAIIYLLSFIKIPEQPQTSSPKKKEKLGLLSAIKVTAQHPILRNIALIMISFNMIYHLSDVTHSAYVKAYMSADSDMMNKYFNYITLYLGLCAVGFSWILSGSFIRQFGLKTSLFVTPVLWGLLSFMDIVASFSPQTGFEWHSMVLPLNLISLSILISVGRAIKFTIFDTTKEMSFLSLDSDKKRMGKAAIDGLSSRFGKSGGAWLLILITSQAGGQVIASLLPLKCVIALSYLLWFYAVSSLCLHLPDEKHTVNSSPDSSAKSSADQPQPLEA